MAWVHSLVLFKFIFIQTIQLSMRIRFNCKKFPFQAIRFCQTILIQTFQFSISMQFNSIYSVDRAQWGATIQSQSRPGSNGNEEVLRISQSLRITGISSSDCLVSYPVHSLVGVVLPLCRSAVGVFYSPSRLSNTQS